VTRLPHRRQDDRHAEPPPRARAIPAPAAPAAADRLLALQRTAGNAAVARALLQRELTEEQAAEKVKKLTTVVAGGGGVPITTDSQRSHFLRAGKEFFGTYEGTIDWFAAIRPAAVPGGIFLHDSAAKRLEAVNAAMGGDMPKRGGGFQLRGEFTESTHFSRLSHHTLGLAVDYDVTDMVRIGSARKEVTADGKTVETTHTADFLQAVTGSPSHADLTDGNRRALIKQMGDTTAAGGDAGKVKGADQLLANIESETDRMAQASAAFQKSLGDQRDKFLELRDQYHATKSPAEKKKVMEAVPAVVKPWLDALENATQSLRSAATSARLDPDKLPSGDAVKAQAAAKAKTAQAATDMGLRYKVADGAEEKPLTDKDRAVLEAWEKELQLPGLGAEKPIMRCAYVAMVADALSRNLAAVAGADVRLKHYADLKKMLVSDPAFLFGTSTAKKADTPSLAQMVESGFFTPGKPGQATDDQGNFDAKFIQEMAKHGFDAGFAWGGAVTDSMHFELVTAKLVN
jgi:hypothetical protein